jgi:fluoroquinolone transport system permease protein
MTSFLLIYPLMLAAIGRYVIPLASEHMGVDITPYNHVVLVAIAMITSKIVGIIAAFSLLDDRDDRIFLAVNVSPLSFDYYIWFKLVIIYLFSFVGTAFVIWFSDLADVSPGVVLAVSFLSAFAAPLSALLINCLATNKIEGFAALKALNTLVIFPIVSLFFSDAKEFIFSFEPGFWPAKALATAAIGHNVYRLSYNQYYFLGLVYVVFLNIIAYLAFKKKVSS